MNILSPSMLSIDFGHMERELLKIKEAGVEMLHVDIMDGMFVPNISFGPPVISYVRKILPDISMDIHAMVQDPIRYLDEYIKLGADILSIHAEATSDLRGDLEKIKERGIKCSVAISPDTPVSQIEDVLELVDMVLIMSVYPGYGGQSFIPEAFDKIRELRGIIERKGLNIDIEVDGGVTLDNVRDVLGAGANVIVAGSAIFGKETKTKAEAFLKLLNEE